MSEANIPGGGAERALANLATPDNIKPLSTLSAQLVSDAAIREQFLADPNAVLNRLGAGGGNVVLSERDKEVVRLIGDQQVSALYQQGNVTGLQAYLRDNYANLVARVPGGAQVEGAAADFDVLIEAEVVAVAVVAVAAAAIGSIEHPQAVAVRPETAVLNARVAGLEARMANIEATLPQGAQGGPAVEGR
jgi:hypothetical protein